MWSMEHTRFPGMCHLTFTHPPPTPTHTPHTHTHTHSHTHTLSHSHTLTHSHTHSHTSFRWLRAAHKRLPVFCRLAITMYAKHMGHVDRVDKNVALSRLRLKRCIKRYHRALFVWYIAIVLNSVIVLFSLLFNDIETFIKSKKRIGYKHWFDTHARARHHHTITTLTHTHTHSHLLSFSLTTGFK